MKEKMKKTITKLDQTGSLIGCAPSWACTRGLTAVTKEAGVRQKKPYYLIRHVPTGRAIGACGFSKLGQATEAAEAMSLILSRCPYAKSGNLEIVLHPEGIGRKLGTVHTRIAALAERDNIASAIIRTLCEEGRIDPTFLLEKGNYR